MIVNQNPSIILNAVNLSGSEFAPVGEVLQHRLHGLWQQVVDEQARPHRHLVESKGSYRGTQLLFTQF